MYRFFTRIYRTLQDISDSYIGVKRGNKRIPDSDQCHEMYAYKKIQMLKDRKYLILLINVFFRS
jgi:hypothetical protein